MTERMELPSLDNLPIARMFSGVPAPPPLFTDGKPNVQAVFAWHEQINAAMYAAEAFASLGVLMVGIKQIGGPPDLSRRHSAHQQSIFDLLRHHRGLRALARNWFLRYHDLMSSDNELRTVGKDPNFLIDLAAIVSLLIEEYPPALPKEDRDATVGELRAALALIVDHAMEGLRPQTKALITAISGFADVVMRLSPKRTVLLELPIGNSIPTKLLFKLLGNRGVSPQVLRIALPRNTSASKGITRQAMIEQRLGDLKLETSDLVVLIDEWVSGANFMGVSDSLRKICNGLGTRFLPAALLTDGSSKDSHFDSYCRAHDKIAEKLEIKGAALRATIPPICSCVERVGYFFWAEYDRISGYRKVQVLGGLIRQIDYALELLSKDPEKLATLQHAVLAKVAAHAEKGEVANLSASSVGKKAEFIALFEQGYKDYQARRDSLCALEHPSNRGDIADLGKDTADVHDLIARAVADRPAGIAIALASTFLESEHIIDVDDPFPLAAHVPVIVELNGGLAEFHARVMESLHASAGEVRRI